MEERDEGLTVCGGGFIFFCPSLYSRMSVCRFVNIVNGVEIFSRIQIFIKHTELISELVYVCNFSGMIPFQNTLKVWEIEMVKIISGSFVLI